MEKLINEFSFGLFFWQLFIFIGLVLLLRKFAWKPILDTINERETFIKNAINSAEEAKKEMASIQEDNQKVLKNISLSVKAGETIAIVGSSGGGKTSLVNLIPRFYDCSEGKILLDGIDIKKFTLENLRTHISLVSQNVTLFNDSVINNIAFGELKDRERERIINAAKIANAHEFIENLPDGYNTEIGDDGVLLSGGQRQRIAIARAILKNAPILILDEATSALDSDSERQIQKALEQLIKDRTSFVIAHRLSTIEKADRILVIEKGEVVEEGSHASLLAANGRYASLYNNDFEEIKDT